MYSVSSGFNDNIAALIRKVYGKVSIDYTDPFLDQTIEATASEDANVSYPIQTADSIVTPTAKYASLDSRWVLGAGYGLAPASQGNAIIEMGWWGAQLSDGSNAFSAPYPTLTVNFVSRPILTLKVVGDSAREEYPVDFTVKLYGTSDVLKHTETVVGNTLIEWTTDISDITEVVKSVLEITKWSHAGCQVKIVEFFTSINEIYEGEDVLEINLTEESEVESGSLPIGNISANEISVKLSNISRKFDAGNKASNLYQLIKPNRKIKAWLGVMVDDVIEYVPLGTFWSGDWDVPEDEVYAKTKGLDRLELLRKSSYSTALVQTNQSLYDLAIDVLTDAGLTEDEYWVDTELQSYIVPYSYFESVSHREALRVIAEAGIGKVYMSRDNVLIVEGPSFLEGATPVVTIDGESYFKKNNPDKTERVANYVEVETQPLKPTTAEQVYISNESISIAPGASCNLTVYYNKTPCINASATVLTGTNVTISASSFYAWGAVITLLNSNAAAQDATFKIDATPLEILNKERAIAQDAASITEHGKLKYTFPTNPLVQTLSVAQSIANTLLASFKDSKRDVALQWRGNPAILLSDIVTVVDSNESNDYNVIKQELNYAGYLRSKLNGRRVI